MVVGVSGNYKVHLDTLPLVLCVRLVVGVSGNYKVHLDTLPLVLCVRLVVGARGSWWVLVCVIKFGAST